MFNEERYKTIPNVTNISDYVTHYAESTPDAVALIDGNQQWTYQKLETEVDILARAMLANGVTPETRVACLSHPNAHCIITLMACARIGAIWVGLNPRYQLSELEHVFRDAKPSIIFYFVADDGRDFQMELSHLRKIHPVQFIRFEGSHYEYIGTSMKEFTRTAGAVNLHDLHARRRSVMPEASALLVYTSGTMGRPKGALIHHAGLIQACRVKNAYWYVDPLCMINFLPINHLGCISEVAMFVIAAGGTQVMLSRFNPITYNQLMEQHRCTIWGGLPTTLQLSLEDPDFDSYDFSTLQRIVWSGAAISEDQLVKLKAVCSNLGSTYGQAESVSSLCYTQQGDSDEVYLNTVGKPVELYEFRLMTKQGKIAELGQTGEIQCRGDFVMRGYINEPESDAHFLDQDGWLKTGDIGLQRPDGNIRLVGRLKDMYKSGGSNVYPREIEMVIESFPGVNMVAVVSKPDPLYSEVGVAFIQVDNPDWFLIDDLEGYCRTKLANYKIPKEFHILDELPLLPVGKIDKKSLSLMVNSQG